MENGHVKEYAISVSDDGKNWGAPILSGRAEDRSFRPDQDISFSSPGTKPFIKFEVTAARSSEGRFLAAIGELDVVGRGNAMKCSK